MKTNVERVLDYLWSVSPNGATNAEIRMATGLQPQRATYDPVETSAAFHIVCELRSFSLAEARLRV
jgi:hypothetical protein